MFLSFCTSCQEPIQLRSPAAGWPQTFQSALWIPIPAHFSTSQSSFSSCSCNPYGLSNMPLNPQCLKVLLCNVTLWYSHLFSPSHLLTCFLPHHLSVQLPLPLSSANTAAPSISFISWLCPCYLNMLAGEISVVNLSFQQSFTLCRVSVVVSCWLFHLCSSLQQYDISQKWLCRQELVLGRQWWSANMIPWQQAVAVISGYTCMELHLLKLF